jgi:hypothetical protein
MAEKKEEPHALNQRSFSLNSAEAYEALCPRAERPWIPNGALPREPRWGRRTSPVHVAAGDEGAADDAVREWMRHVDAACGCGADWLSKKN